MEIDFIFFFSQRIVASSGIFNCIKKYSSQPKLSGNRENGNGHDTATIWPQYDPYTAMILPQYGHDTVTILPQYGHYMATIYSHYLATILSGY